MLDPVRARAPGDRDDRDAARRCLAGDQRAAVASGDEDARAAQGGGPGGRRRRVGQPDASGQRGRHQRADRRGARGAQQRDLGRGGRQFVEQRAQGSRVAERGLDGDERRRRRNRAGEARPVDGETGDGGLEPESLQDGLGRCGRDGRDDVGAGREPLGAASAAQRRPAAEEGRDDRRRRLAQRDGARPGLVGVEHVDGVEAAAHEGEPHAGGDCHRNRDAAGGGAGRDGQAEADGDDQRHARRRRQGGGVSPGQGPQPPASLQQQRRLAGGGEDDHLVAALRERTGQRRPVVVGLARAIPGVRRDEADAHPDGSVSGSGGEGSGCGHRAHTCPRAVQELVHRVRVEAELGADLPRGAAAAGQRQGPALALREPADG